MGINNHIERKRGRALRGFRVPIWVRLLPVGLALVVGSFIFALVRTYIAFAQGWQGAIAEGGEEPAPFADGLVRWALREVIASASPAGAIFWLGAGVLGLALVFAVGSIVTRSGRGG